MNQSMWPVAVTNSFSRTRGAVAVGDLGVEGLEVEAVELDELLAALFVEQAAVAEDEVLDFPQHADAGDQVAKLIKEMAEVFVGEEFADASFFERFHSGGLVGGEGEE